MKHTIYITTSFIFLFTASTMAQINPNTKIFKKAFAYDFKTVKEKLEYSLKNTTDLDYIFFDLWYKGLLREKNKHYIDATEMYEKAFVFKRSEMSPYEVKFSMGRVELLKAMGVQGTTYLYEFISEAKKEVDDKTTMWVLTEKGKKELRKKIELAEALLAFAETHKAQLNRSLPMQTPRNENPFRKPAERFFKKLTKKANLSGLFSEGWTLSYYKDDRCEGVTTGSLEDLKPEQIDTDIEITLNNDGHGWGDCSRKERSSFNFQFNLKQLVQNWNRYEISDNRQMELHIFYIMGGGESEYLKIHFNEQKKIIKLEYRSEDPG